MTHRARRDWLLFGVAVAVNLAVLYWPRAVSQPAVPEIDKLVHVAIFAAVAWTGVRAGIPRWWLVAVLAVHAVTSELVQALFLPARSGDPVDALADLLGVAIGTLGGSWRHDRGRRRDRPDRPVARGDSCAG